MSRQGHLNGRYTHGRFSRYMPGPLARKVRESRDDPEVMTCREDLLVLDGFLKEALEKLRSGETGSLWGDAQAAWAEVAALLRSGRADAAAEAAPRLDAVFRDRGADLEAREEVLDLLERRTKVVSREWKRLEALGAVLTAQQGVALVRAIVASVERHVADPEARRKIGEDLINLCRGPRHAQLDG